MATKLPLPGGKLELRSSGDLAADPQTRILYNRGKFVEDYAARKGWPTDGAMMSIDQIMEIRSQPEWKHAGLLPYPEPPVETMAPVSLADVALEPPPTGDDLTAIAHLWGVKRGEMGDSQVIAQLMAVRTRVRYDTATRDGLEAALTSVDGIDRVRISDEIAPDTTWCVVYQGALDPSEVVDALKEIAPVMFRFAVERLEGKWPH